MAEIDLTDREQFEAWLHRQTREVCVAIAARAALRVLPSVILEFVTEPASPRNASALPILRALALALATAKHQNRWDELQPVAVRLPLGILEVVSLESHSGSAADWAYAAVDTIATTIGQEFTADSIRAIQRVLTIYGSADNVDQNRDLQIIEKGGSARFLANSPLLEDDEARSWHNSAWLSAKSRIVNLGQGWDVWTRWYDAVLDGKPTPGGEALDIYRVMLDSEEDWKQGPAHVNGLIRKREYELVPSDVVDAVVTASDSGTADGVSQTVTSEASDTLTATATVRWNYFLSYSTKDEVFAKWIVALLQQNGRSVFAQFKDIKQGNNFVREMQKGLARSNQLIALLSPDYEKSDHCQAEWAAAYRLDPSGNARKILPFMIRPTTPNELAGPFVYVPLVGLSEQDASSAVLNALGLGNHREMPTVEWPGSEMMRPLIEATGGIYGVEPDGELRLNLRPPRISDEKTSNLTSAQLYSSAAETIQRFAAHCRSSPGNRRCSERMLRRAGELDEVAAKPLETCNALALNDCLVWVLRVIVLDQMDGVIPPNDELGFHASDLLGLYNRLPSIFPQLKDYRALKVGERFIPPDADAAKAIEAIKDRFGEESLQSQVFAAVLARDLETSVANALEASSESALRNDVASRNQEVESHKGAAARIMSVWDWLANARQKFVRSGKNAAEVTEAIENYEKLYGKLAPSMLKLIEYLMKWLT